MEGLVLRPDMEPDEKKAWLHFLFGLYLEKVRSRYEPDKEYI